MLNNKNNLLLSLHRLGLTADEGKVYLALLDEPMSHLEIARKTGVNRTKVYRIADNLEKRGLITETVNEDGREIAANSPSNLEITLTTEEEKIKDQRAILGQTLPALQQLFSTSGQPDATDFVVNTYEGVDGFKQMLWNELKTENQILIFGDGSIQDLIGSARWAEKHREKTVEAGYKIKEILNPKSKPSEFTKNQDFMEQSYQRRFISPETLPLGHQVCVYNNTVSIYNWRNGQKIGTEIINKQFADFQRAIFESYWKIAK